MNNYNSSPYRNQYGISGTRRPMASMDRYCSPSPQTSTRGGYGAGFCDGFCNGISSGAGKVLEVVGSTLALTTKLFR